MLQAWSCNMDGIFALLCLVLTLTTGQATAQCPHQCVCFSSTVRCMFLQLDAVPTDVPPDTTVLDLRFNRISTLPLGVFMRLHNLETLLLNNNEIKHLEAGAFKGLVSLKSLYLYKNEIKSIEKDAFKDLRHLEQLYLHFNKLTSIELGTFDNLHELDRLFLHNNSIQHLPEGILKDSRQLRRLRLDSNSLKCDCGMIWLSKMLRDNPNMADSGVVCQGPKGLEGKAIATLNEEHFLCKMPRFTREPTDVFVQGGGTVQLICEAIGDPTPEITWLHNSREVETNSLEARSRYEQMEDGSLRIYNTDPSDEGTYECVAKNTMGEIRTNAVSVRWRPQAANSHASAIQNEREQPQNEERPRIDIEQEETGSFIVGDTLDLSCRGSGSPLPTMKWERNDLPLPFDPRITETDENGVGRVLITSLRSSDTGLYRCTATNNAGQVTQFIRVEIFEPPEFIQTPKNKEVVEGHSAFFSCDATGEPVPTITWTKDGIAVGNFGRVSVNPSGTTLSITRVKASDAGVYTCIASIGRGRRIVDARLTVRHQRRPLLIRAPVDTAGSAGTTATLYCTFEGDPPPRIKWLKDNIPIPLTTGEKYDVLPDGTLRIKDLQRSDVGSYECVGNNVGGTTIARATLTLANTQSNNIDGVDGGQFNTIIQESITRVDQAVSNTLRDLRDPNRRRTPSDLLRLMRYPPRHAVQLSRAAEIYEQALESIFNEVHGGAQYANISFKDSAYEELLTPAQLRILSTLSGCEQHRRVVNCDDMCFHHKYRTMDGTCNNLQNPMKGSSLSPLIRLQPPRYENGFNLPLGWTADRLVNDQNLPSARTVSLELAATDQITLDPEFTHMLMQWGQFVDHDLDFVPVSVSNARFTDGRFCNETCDNQSPCFAIPVADNDPRIHHRRCIGFARSSAMCGSGVTSVAFQKVMHRDQLNLITSYIDASNVYGNSDEDSRNLRDFAVNQGRMRTGLVMPSGKPMPPSNSGEFVDCQRDASASHVPCFQTGDHRSNEQLGLLSMHTIWFREHNRMAQELYRINPHWDGDMIFHEARKIMGAMHQHITYKHWLPVILGPKGMEMLGEYRGYNSSVDPSILNAFATGAFRFGHSLINPFIHRLNESFHPIPEGNLPLHKAFFAPFRIIDEGGIDPILRGLFAAPAKKPVPNELLNNELTEKLFKLAHEVSLDLAALNIQRGRDHGLASYNDYREYCGLGKAASFQQFRNTIRSSRARRKLERVYGHVDNVELWIGGLLEDVDEGAKVGPTFMCIIAEQFKRLREGDRFFYENPGVFEPGQLAEIQHTTLARVICDNSDNIGRVQQDVFRLVLSDSDFKDCDSPLIPSINLKLWTQCCHDCAKSGDFGSVTTTHTRTRRSTEYSYSEDRENALFDAPKTRDSTMKEIRDDLSQAMMDNVDLRVEGLEDLVVQMHTDIKALNKKIREMGYSMDEQSSCIDHNGHRKETGAVWLVDNCEECQCINGVSECTRVECPSVPCENPHHTQGNCCPVCN